MGRDHVELVQEAIDAINRRDADALVALCHPDVEIRSLFAELSDGGGYRGHDGVRRYVADLREAFRYGELLASAVVAGDDVVVVTGLIRFGGAASGVSGTTEAGWLWRIRDRRIVLFRAFADPAEARRAGGVR